MMKYDFYNRTAEIKELTDAFKQKVINKRSLLGYIVQGRKGVGKSRLIHKFLNKLEFDIELHSDIPGFEIEKHVIEYICDKDKREPYLPFIRITEEIRKRNKLYNVFIRSMQLGLAVFGVNDALNALNDLVKTIDKGKNDKIIIKKETSTFNKYRRFIKRKGQKTPLVIYIQNAQWLDKESLRLIKKLAYDANPLNGMIILETDDTVINEEFQNTINQFVFDGAFQRLHVHAMDKHFPARLLSSRFGEEFFTNEENEMLFTVSEGCPGILIGTIERYIDKKWISATGSSDEEWQKVSDFKEKIKPPSQKLMELIISLYEDKELSESEKTTIEKMSTYWNLSNEYVAMIINMVKDIMDHGYKILKDFGTGIISKHCFLVSDTNNNHFIAEYVKSQKEVDIRHLKARDIHHKNLLEAREIKTCNSGIMILWDYFEGKRARQVIIEAFEKHTIESVQKMKDIASGLAELHRNNIVHGFIKPESIIQNNEGKFQLATFDISLFQDMNIDSDGFLNTGNGNTNNTNGLKIDWDSLYYLSPEQLKGKTPGKHSDIFSLGVVFYKTLTNRLPYHGNNKKEALESIKKNKINFSGYLLSTISEEIKNIINKCLDPDPEKRYANAEEFLKALNKIEIDPLPKPEKEEKPAPKPVKFRKYAIGGAAIIALAAAIYFLLIPEINVGPEKEIIVQDFVTVDVDIDNQTKKPGKIISPEVIEYLITDDLMQSSSEKVLTVEGFNKIAPESKTKIFVPKTRVNAQIINHDFNSEIDVEIINNTAKGQTINNYKIDFNTPSELLRGDITELTKTILNKEKLKVSTFTEDWEAFMAFFDGEKAWSKLDKNKALDAYRKAIAIDPDFVLAKLRTAEVYRFGGNNSQAIGYIYEVQPHLGKLSKADSLKALALKNKLSGNITEAKRNYQDIISLLPARKEPYYDLAEALFELRDIGNAKKSYSQALDLDSLFTQAINHYAYCFTHQGDHKEALKHFRKYLFLDSSANAFDSYGDGLMAAGMLDSAAWAKEMGLKLDPGLDYLYNSLNYINVRKGDFDKAEQNVNKYIELQSNTEMIAEGYTNKALIYFAKGDYEMALDTCLKAQQTYDTIDLVARNHKMHWLLGQLYFYLGKPGKFRQELEEMENIIAEYEINEHNYNEVYKFYMHLLALKHANDQNIKGLNEIYGIFNGPLYDKIKDWSSPFDIAYFNTEFGILYLKHHETQKALKALNKALEYNNNYALAHLHLIELYLVTGNEKLQEKHHEAYREVRK